MKNLALNSTLLLNLISIMKTQNKTILFIMTSAIILFIGSTAYSPSERATTWTNQELALIQSLRLPRQWEISDPSNTYLHNPEAAKLGELLFLDTQLSRSKQIACSSCHQPDYYFTLAPDSEITLDKQVPSLLGGASFNWYMLDGSADSLWAQALKPLENHLEHGGTRTQYVQYVLNRYPQLYQAIFGYFPTQLTSSDLPAQASPISQSAGEQQSWQKLGTRTQTEINRVYANIGKSLAAYQATLWPQEARFDRYIDQISAPSGAAEKAILNANEIAGLKLFISEKAQCLRCHNGPLLTNGDFHVTVVPEPHSAAQQGRLAGIESALADPFNCLSLYSDSEPTQCKELLYSKRGVGELEGATKVPSLRNIAATAPYMHAGQFSTLNEVLNYYNRAATPFGRHNDLNALKLLPYQIKQLEAFLLALTENSTDE
ncbi:methylamine utilization protein [Photobacterium sp. SDRW27]|uniref:cytochrome-c peroxidase n=1 Tax=Photobacterium obscurum TaxID=2829490 RepID=UPI002244C47A|nr:cytochrome c peroxidase [Photobacterium obscurum]MCW8331415.1 methylamine utilization protein [Photobacterium obscurum]